MATIISSQGPWLIRINELATNETWLMIWEKKLFSTAGLLLQVITLVC